MAVSFVKNKLKYSPMPMVKPVAFKEVTINKPSVMRKKKAKVGAAKAMRGIM